MNDAISRSAAIDIINEERRFIESLRETVYDNEDRAHNTGELGCAIGLARKIKELPALDVEPVVHGAFERRPEEVIPNLRANPLLCKTCNTTFITLNKEGKRCMCCSYCGAKMDGEAE